MQLAAYRSADLYRVQERLLLLPVWHGLEQNPAQNKIRDIAETQNEAALYSLQLDFRADFLADLSWQKYLRSICWPHAVDFFCVERSMWQQKKGLAVFDMDATLIRNEVIDELAAEHQVGHQVAEITERAMRGDMDFNASIRARVALLKGLSVQSFSAVRKRLVEQDGLRPLFRRLQRTSIKTAIVSGGFAPFAQPLAEGLAMDHVYSNHLETDAAGYLTGNLTGNMINAASKADLLLQLAQHYELSLRGTIAVGDGANDIPMLQNAGTGVAYYAKPKVNEQIAHAICHTDLRCIGLLVA